MQIYSKHSDYYDPILYQISSLDRFVRTQDHKKKITVGSLPEGITKLPLSNKLQYLFFCGSVYPFIETEKEKPIWGDALNKEPSFLWSFDEIYNHFKKFDRFYFNFDERNLLTCFNISVGNDIQLASGVCYFIFKPHYGFNYSNKLVNSDIAGDLVLYPSLKDIQFYRIVNAYIAAQQIDYWLGNIFVSDNCPSTQTNDEKVVAHGHDLKVSFRDSSGKGKKKYARKTNSTT